MNISVIFSKWKYLIKINQLIYIKNAGKTTNFKPDFSVIEKSPAKWATAFYFGLYSYDGWSALNNIVEEIKKPKRY